MTELAEVKVIMTEGEVAEVGADSEVTVQCHSSYAITSPQIGSPNRAAPIPDFTDTSNTNCKYCC